MFALCAERSKEPVEKSRYYVWEFIMKKNILRIVLPVLTMYAAAALEMTVPEFHFGVLVAKQPNEKQFSIVQESAINFRLLQGERFYSDLNLSLHIPDIIRFFHPQQYARSIGQFAFADFSPDRRTFFELIPVYRPAPQLNGRSIWKRLPQIRDAASQNVRFRCLRCFFTGRCTGKPRRQLCGDGFEQRLFWGIGRMECPNKG